MTPLPEPHRLDGGEMPKDWYIEAWEYGNQHNRALRKENERLRKLLIRIKKVSGEA